jgi:hypothetical protein
MSPCVALVAGADAWIAKGRGPSLQDARAVAGDTDASGRSGHEIARNVLASGSGKG